MSTGPLRRTTGIVGMLALVPVLLQLVQGAITPEAAAIRGLAIAGVVVALGHAIRLLVAGLLGRVERRAEDGSGVSTAVAGDGAGASS